MQQCTNHKSCLDEAMKKAVAICQHQGLQFTPLRKKVLQMVWQDHYPTKAYDILGKLNQRGASAKPPTVYRALDFLLKYGMVHKLHSINAFIGCSHPQQHRACYFLICSQCGEVRECCNSSLDQVISNTSSKNKFAFKHITLEINGQCSQCQKTH